ncbi:MAG: NAD(P)H-hydrate dehydratase [Myxococcaceae bacterium]|nr:NAD(P)H-hydrate dehydratase [Myxococcaceae bacterium]
MKRALSSAEMRAVDQLSARYGVLPEVLMFNAGTVLAQEALAHASSRGQFIVVCGTGNNGGDGLVAALALSRANRRVFVALVGDAQTLKGEPRRLFDEVTRAQLPLGKASDQVEVAPGDVVVDALFGTGLSRAPAAEYAVAITQIARWRAQGATVVSADVPSGLQSDTGQIFEPCVRADATVSFGLFKVGQLLEPGQSACGVQRCADIGLPAPALAAAQAPMTWLVEEADAKAVLPVRRADTHKGTYGHVAVIAGSDGKSGAAALTGCAVLKSGAGLVTIAARSRALSAALAHAPELMGHALSDAGPLGMADFDGLAQLLEKKDAVVIGPGIPRGPETADLICALMKQFAVPWVLDADAINAFEGQAGRLKGLTSQVLLTPHPGEMARLLGVTTQDIAADRLGVARRLASQIGATIVLKGARTVTADPVGTCFINPTGNAGMATGGCGDVLSGICGAFLAQGVTLPLGAYAAVYAHGLAGDLRVTATGQLGLLASDILQGLNEVWVRWKR